MQLIQQNGLEQILILLNIGIGFPDLLKNPASILADLSGSGAKCANQLARLIQLEQIDGAGHIVLQHFPQVDVSLAISRPHTPAGQPGIIIVT